MSEYQYHEFQAVDRPLTRQEMAELRALSTRAAITPTRFQNTYHWGNFKGDPLTVTARYFDAYVYVANWGTHQLMLRLPANLLDLQTVRSYAIDGSLDVHGRDDDVILEFTSEDEEGAGWVDDDESASWMPGLLQLRGELASGDMRALYLGWLAGVEAGMLDDEELEPMVPAGLGNLSAALETLTRFSRISEDLLVVVAARSVAFPDEPSQDDIERWIENLPIAEKNRLLNRLASGSEAHLHAEIRRQILEANARHLDASAGVRTVGELLSAAYERADKRRRDAAERKAAEDARLERERAEARTAYLNSLVGREDELWGQVEAFTNAKRPKEYDQAVQLLKDLHDVSVLDESATPEFAARLSALRARCAKRLSLIERLDRAGLRA